MKRRFYRYVILVSGIHVFAIMVLVVFSAITTPIKEENENFITVGMVFDATQPPPDILTDTREDSEPLEPPPDKIPKRKKKSRPEVEVSKTKITRRDAEQSAEKDLNRGEILDRLTHASQNESRKRTSVPDQRYLNLIKSILYQAWAEPSIEEVGTSKTVVKIELDSRGRIIEREIVTGSGNAAMDVSVMAALNKVHKINGLSVDFISRHAVVTIGFRVQS